PSTTRASPATPRANANSVRLPSRSGRECCNAVDGASVPEADSCATTTDYFDGGVRAADGLKLQQQILGQMVVQQATQPALQGPDTTTAPAPLAAATTGHRGAAAIAIVLVAASRAHRRPDPKKAPWVGSHPQFVLCGDRIFGGQLGIMRSYQRSHRRL